MHVLLLFGFTYQFVREHSGLWVMGGHSLTRTAFASFALVTAACAEEGNAMKVDGKSFDSELSLRCTHSIIPHGNVRLKAGAGYGIL